MPWPLGQGSLTTLSMNSSLTDVLAAERAGRPDEAARSGLAVAEAQRRLGRVGDADRAWKASCRAAREAGDPAAMAWALWSGGTLARQRGAFTLARRLLELAAELAELARASERTGLRRAREMVARAQREFGGAEGVR